MREVLHASAADVTRRWPAEHPNASATFAPGAALETGGLAPFPLARNQREAEEGNDDRKTRGSAASKKQLQAHAHGPGPMSLPLVTLRLKRPAEPAAPAAARECKPRVAAPPSEELAAANALRGLFAAAPPAPAPAAASAQSKRVLSMVRTSPCRPPVTPPVASHLSPTSASYPHPSQRFALSHAGQAAAQELQAERRRARRHPEARADQPPTALGR